MKLIYAIVRNDNEDDVMDALNKDHFQVTKLASTGGFLRKGNSTLMIATQDDMVDECIELIKKQCGKRQKITVNMPYVSGTSMGTYTTMPMPVEIGGATNHVLHVGQAVEQGIFGVIVQMYERHGYASNRLRGIRAECVC